jgi:hypothetical protein
MLLVWFVMVVFLAAWTLWFQAYIYTEPVERLLWRAPAAGSLVFLTLLLWVYFDYHAPGEYSTLWQFAPYEDSEYAELIVVRQDGKEDVYKKVARGRVNVYLLRNEKPLPSRPEKIIAVTADGERETFEPDRGANGNYKTDAGQNLMYRSASGKVMEEGQLGRVRKFYYGRLFLNLFLNFFHLFAWFACLWLLLRYQWSHALLMAVVLWLVMILFIVPQVLRQTESAAHETAVQRTTLLTGEKNPLDGVFPSG